MSKAPSVDLRERVLVAVAIGATHREVADRFGVSVRRMSVVGVNFTSARVICAQARSAETATHRIGAHSAAILAWLAARRDGTLAELRESMALKGIVVSQRHCIASWFATTRRVKKTGHAAEQNRPDVLQGRKAWFESYLDFEPEHLVLIDESWTVTNKTVLTADVRKGSGCVWASSWAPQNHDVYRGLVSRRDRCLHYVGRANQWRLV